MPDQDSDQDAVEHVRELARSLVPDAVDGLGYGMPALRYRDRPLISVMPARHHIGLYPFSPAVVEAVAGRLRGYSFAKGTIRFTADHPLPDDLIEEIVLRRRDEIDHAIDGPA
jgi:uncharacterized protein YdhG (YjbR/CyaY superfamily)